MDDDERQDSSNPALTTATGWGAARPLQFRDDVAEEPGREDDRAVGQEDSVNSGQTLIQALILQTIGRSGWSGRSRRMEKALVWGLGG